jgi:hypothetical protein
VRSAGPPSWKPAAFLSLRYGNAVPRIFRSPASPIFFHVHVPKCGGSSLNVLLERCFKDRFAYLYNDEPEHILSVEEIGDFVARNPTVDCIASHGIRVFPPLVNDRPAHYITFLRNPVDRLVSCARHLVREFPGLNAGHDRYLLDAQSPPELLSKWVHHASKKLFSDPLGTSSLARYFLPPEQIALGSVANPSGDSTQAVEAINLIALLTLGKLRRFFFVGDFDNFEPELRRLASALTDLGFVLPVTEIPRERVSIGSIFESAEQERSIRDELYRITELDRRIYDAVRR